MQVTVPRQDHAHDVVLDDTGAESAAAVFRLLADPTRLSLVWHLREAEHSVTELAHLVDRPSPAVSQHLAKLRLARLVSTRRDGTTVWYRLDNEHVGRLVVDALSHAQHAEETA
jgi:DNA-binding transcriptional ArsR family regulator